MASRRVRAGALVGAVAVLAGVVAWNVTRDSRNRISVQTENVEKRDLTSVVSASGEIRPKRYVNVGANVSGRIESLLVSEGQRVEKGQVLARIESTRFEAGTRQSEAALQTAEAELRRAQADLEAARLAFERAEKMQAEKLISDQDFERARAEIQMKQAAVDAQRRRIAQQQAVLASNRDELEKTTVVAPMDGVVINLQKEQGEVVIGAQSFSPSTILTVADLSSMEVEVLVDETDIAAIELGQPAEVRVDALVGQQLRGEVTEIGSSALPRGQTGAAAIPGASSTNTGNQAKDFKVVVTLIDPPAALRPGLNATADITTARREGVLAVPIQSVVIREVDKEGKVVDPGAVQAAGGEPETASRARGEEKEGVFRVQDGKAVFTPIGTGIMGDTEIQVTEGLAPGDVVVSGSYKTLRTLKDQALVKVEKERKDRT